MIDNPMLALLLIEEQRKRIEFGTGGRRTMHQTVRHRERRRRP
jgi:hypothetical protein